MIARAAGDLVLCAGAFLAGMTVIGAVHRWWYR